MIFISIRLSPSPLPPIADTYCVHVVCICFFFGARAILTRYEYEFFICSFRAALSIVCLALFLLFRCVPTFIAVCCLFYMDLSFNIFLVRDPRRVFTSQPFCHCLLRVCVRVLPSFYNCLFFLDIDLIFHRANGKKIQIHFDSLHRSARFPCTFAHQSTTARLYLLANVKQKPRKEKNSRNMKNNVKLLQHIVRFL